MISEHVIKWLVNVWSNDYLTCDQMISERVIKWLLNVWSILAFVEIILQHWFWWLTYGPQDDEWYEGLWLHVVFYNISN